MKQTRLISLIESTVNIGSGFILSMLVWQLIANPVMGYNITWGENVALTTVFTCVSLARHYVWRRVFTRFDRRLHEILDR